MKNFKTTLAGIVAGLPLLIDALIQAYNAGAFTGKSGSQLFLSIALIIIGYILKDPKKTL
ncbi:MAG: hypothetical protein RL308_3247 [Bacteroidota bacterium]|jgi:hypothetical protein